MINSVVANPATLVEGGSVTLSIVVSDVDGVADITGGEVTDVNTGTVLQTFNAPVGQGTVLQVTSVVRWSDLNAAQAIQFPAGGGTRDINVSFHDRAGHTGTQRVTLPLRCSTSSLAACAGVCIDLSSSTLHCGRCNNPVPTNGDCQNSVPGCYNGTTLCNGTCTTLEYDENNCVTCGNRCSTWASSHGLPAGSDVRCYSGCQVYFDQLSTRQACGTTCGQYSLNCVPNAQRCISSAPVAPACAIYSASSDSCVINGFESLACDTTPPASGTCSSMGLHSGAAATFWYMDCACK